MATRHRLSLIIFSGDFDRVHYAFAMASAAAATDRPVTMFFSGRALRFFLAEAADGTPGWAALAPAENGKTAIERDTELCSDGIGTIEELAMACVELNVAFFRCDMGVKASKLDATTFRSDLPTRSGGLVSFLAEAEKEDSQVVFI
jgi:peroxiredoxin family protein